MMKLVLATLLATSTAACVTDVAPYETPDESDLPPEGSEAALANNPRTAFNYFVTKGFTAVQAAGIVGNLMQESSVRPTAVEYGGGPGRGIAQWGVGGRWDTGSASMRAYAAARGVNRWALGPQLDFIWHELSTVRNYGLEDLRATSTITSAVTVFQDQYEKCGTCAKTKRIQYANQVLRDYGGGVGTDDPGTDPAPTPGGDSSCYSATLAQEVPENTCVQARSDGEWYQCAAGEWIDRWSDPEACASEHPL